MISCETTLQQSIISSEVNDILFTWHLHLFTILRHKYFLKQKGDIYFNPFTG